MGRRFPVERDEAMSNDVKLHRLNGALSFNLKGATLVEVSSVIDSKSMVKTGKYGRGHGCDAGDLAEQGAIYP